MYGKRSSSIRGTCKAQAWADTAGCSALSTHVNNLLAQPHPLRDCAPLHLHRHAACACSKGCHPLEGGDWHASLQRRASAHRGRLLTCEGRRCGLLVACTVRSRLGMWSLCLGHYFTQIARDCCPSTQTHSSEPSWTPRYLCTLLAGSLRHSLVLRGTGDIASITMDKEQLLEAAELPGLHLEQRAAVDFVVLVRAQRFVGVQISSFSFFVVEYRKMRGIAPEPTC